VSGGHFASTVTRGMIWRCLWLGGVETVLSASENRGVFQFLLTHYVTRGSIGSGDLVLERTDELLLPARKNKCVCVHEL